MNETKSWEDICPDTYRTINKAILPQSQYNKTIEWEYNSNGLFLFGPKGTKKRCCAYSLLAKLYSQGFDMIGTTATELVHQAGRKKYYCTIDDWATEYINAPVLFISGLGDEPQQDRGSNEVYHIIKRRAEELFPLIITSDYDLDEILRRMPDTTRGSALVRRLREFCTPIAF